MNLKLAIISSCISLVLFATNVYSGKPESRLLFSVTAQNTIRLGVINSTKQDLMLEIVNRNGNVFLSQLTKSGTNFFQLFDVTKLPDGDYDVKLTGEDFNLKRKFAIDKRIIKIKTVIEPKVSQVDNETLLVFYNNSENHNISIFLEQNNEVVFEENKIKDAIVNKRLSLKKIPKGKYIVKLWIDNESYHYPIEVK